MIFTREDILKIQNALLQLGRKDSEFKDADTPLNSDDEIAILQDGINKKVSINNLLSTLGLLKKDDFINVSDRYDEYYIQLSEAITIIAKNKRKKGLVVTFQDLKGDWQIYQFTGEVQNFVKTELWRGLFDFKYPIVNSVLPDEEDLTLTYPDSDGNSFIQLKDKEYDPENFSGMATKILRKNIVEVGGVKKNILTQDMINEENTIYEIRYDFDLNDEEITIPKECVLDFKGGSLNNGIINFNNCYMFNYRFKNIIVNDEYNRLINVDLFIEDKNNIRKDIIDSLINNCRCLYFPKGTYNFNFELKITKSSKLKVIYGDTDNDTRLNFNNCNGIIIEKRIKLLNLYIQGTDCKGVYNSNKLIYENGFCGIDVASGCDLLNITVYTFMIGINIVRNHIIKGLFSNITLSYNGNCGLYLIHNAGTGQKNNLVFEHVYCVKNGYDADNLHSDSTLDKSGFGIYVKGGYSNSFRNCVCEYNTGIGMFFDTPDSSSTLNGLELISNYFERNKYINALLTLEDNIAVCKNIVLKSFFYADPITPLPLNSYPKRELVIKDEGLRALKNIYNNISIDTINYNTLSYSLIYNNIDIGNNVVKEDNIYYFQLNSTNKNISYNSILSRVLDIGIYSLVVTTKCNKDFNKIGIITLGNADYISDTYMRVHIKNSNKTTNYCNFLINDINKVFSYINLYFSGGLSEDEVVNINFEIIKAISCTSAELDKIKTMPIGYTIYNSTIKKQVIWNGTSWDPDDKLYNIPTQGTFNQKPAASTGIPIGFTYFCTDKQTSEGSTNGIIIYHKGNDVWVDALGRVVS